jgi:orotidine-5'-phosphate decarboxylase
MHRSLLIEKIRTKKSYLIVGLDPDMEKLPTHLSKSIDHLISFCKDIIEATHDLAVGYKINTAFFEAYGWEGIQAMEVVKDAIPKDCFTIADAKRGDISNTANQYAKAFFEKMNFDSITLSPWMGKDSIEPYLQYQNKWSILLGLTSNSGADDFELYPTSDSKFMYETVLEKSSTWGSIENTMYVVGATQDVHFENIRKILPNHFLLIPGVGAQGGSLGEVSKKLIINDIGILVNSSREILYASASENFADEARKKAKSIQEEMQKILS